MSNKSDATIIREVLGGNTESFGYLADRYYRLCVHYLMNAMFIDRETAYDLTQDAFARAFKSLASFSTERPFKPWLMRICRNLAIDNLKNKNRKALNLFENAVHTADPSESTVEHLDLKNAIGQLTARQQEIVEMHYFWALTCNEIAEILLIPPGTVKSELFLSRKRMLSILEKEV